MRIIAQRVTRGSVTVGGEITGQIERGFVVLVGVREGDTVDDARQLAHKTVNLRVFADENDKMNLSVMDIQGKILVISQFTLYANTRKGNRPSFVRAARPELAQKLYLEYVEALRRDLGDSNVCTGVFGAMMSVEIINDGPVTIELHTD